MKHIPMYDGSDEKSLQLFSFVQPIFIVTFMLAIIFVSTLIIVRNKCITVGYAISTLSQELESSSLVAERLSLEYSKVARNEILINKGLKAGFTLIDTGRVFYVQRDKN